MTDEIFVLTVKTKSMMPHVHPGDRLYLDKREANAGELVAVELAPGGTFILMELTGRGDGFIAGRKTNPDRCLTLRNDEVKQIWRQHRFAPIVKPSSLTKCTAADHAEWRRERARKAGILSGISRRRDAERRRAKRPPAR